MHRVKFGANGSMNHTAGAGGGALNSHGLNVGQTGLTAADQKCKAIAQASLVFLHIGQSLVVELVAGRQTVFERAALLLLGLLPTMAS
jgi:TPP-dependent trihydroxycyclohexane-1,2-dione (THcHDO) dehydratase